MTNVDIIKPVHDALSSIAVTVNAASEFAHILPDDIEFRDTWVVLAERLEGDLTALRLELFKLYSFIPEQVAAQKSAS